MSDEDDNEWEFTIPMKVKRLPLRKCDECGKRKLSTTFYEVHDTGLNAHKDYNVCKKCMKEARARVRVKSKRCKHNWIRFMEGYGVWFICEKCGKVADQEDQAGRKAAKKHQDNLTGEETITFVDMPRGTFGVKHVKTKRDLSHCKWKHRAEANSYWEILDRLVDKGTFTKEDKEYIENSRTCPPITAHIEIYNKRRKLNDSN